MTSFVVCHSLRIDLRKAIRKLEIERELNGIPTRHLAVTWRSTLKNVFLFLVQYCTQRWRTGVRPPEGIGQLLNALSLPRCLLCMTGRRSIDYTEIEEEKKIKAASGGDTQETLRHKY